MKLQILIFCLCATIILNSSEVIDGLKKEVSVTSMPDGYESLIKNIQANAFAYIASYKVAEYSESIKKFNFPDEILNKFDTIVWSQSLKFQFFKYSITVNNYHATEFFGLARNNNGLITFGFINATASGVTTHPLPDCSSYQGFFQQICKEEKIKLEQKYALTPAQIKLIQTALQSYSNKVALEKLNNPPKSFSDYEKEQEKYDSLQKFSGKNCSVIALNCQTQSENMNCFFPVCKEQSGFVQIVCEAETKKICTPEFEKTHPKSSDCYKCICINYKLKHNESTDDCF